MVCTCNRSCALSFSRTVLPVFLCVCSFARCKPDPGLCLEEIKRLDSDELYMKKLSTPLLKGNVIPPWLTFEHLAKQIIQVWDFHKMLKH